MTISSLHYLYNSLHGQQGPEDDYDFQASYDQETSGTGSLALEQGFLALERLKHDFTFFAVFFFLSTSDHGHYSAVRLPVFFSDSAQLSTETLARFGKAFRLFSSGLLFF